MDTDTFAILHFINDKNAAISYGATVIDASRVEDHSGSHTTYPNVIDYRVLLLLKKLTIRPRYDNRTTHDICEEG